MTVYVDADACPVVEKIERIAQNYGVPVMLLCDQAHELTSSYSTVERVARGSDAVDYRILGLVRRGDIVVTQDIGLAAMAMAKGARCISPYGMIYTDENIDGLLMRRHIAREARHQGIYISKASKRKKRDDVSFAEQFERLVYEALGEAGRQA